MIVIPIAVVFMTFAGFMLVLHAWGRREYRAGQDSGWTYRGAIEAESRLQRDRKLRDRGLDVASRDRLIAELEAAIHRLTQGCAEDSARIEELETGLRGLLERVNLVAPDHNLTSDFATLLAKD